MRSPTTLLVSAAIALGTVQAVDAVPRPETDRPQYIAMPEVAPDPIGVQGAASAGTTYFGGTFWAADSGRWEAIQDSAWTFETGVGSHFDHSAPYVNPFKDPSLHAYMEGWVGQDLTYEEATPYFRRLGETDFTTGTPCVGDVAGLGGDFSLWCGVLAEEAADLCFVDGQGYGNSWNVCIGQSFAYAGGNATLSYDYVVDLEPDFDYVYVYADTSDNPGDEVLLTAHTGALSGTESIPLSPGSGLPPSPGGSVRILFCFDSDGAYSDEDGFYTTDCGGFALDDIALTGAISHSADFETGDDGWTIQPAPPGLGDWSRIEAVADLPPLIGPCECALGDSVVTFYNPNSGLVELDQDNVIVSPWIDLAGADQQKPGKFVEMDMYGDLPFGDNVFIRIEFQWYPELCPVTGKLGSSDWTSDSFVFHLGNEPECRTGDSAFHRDYTNVVPPGAEQVRMRVGVEQRCLGYSCGTGNSTPYLDRVRLGLYGTSGTPALTQRNVLIPRDNFPENGTLFADAPARLDASFNRNFGGAVAFSSLGDTLVVDANAENIEVRVQFAVDPGPGIDVVELNAWLTSHQFEETKDGLDWYSARMDSAHGGFPSVGAWMTAYHEEDPNFSGTDTDTDPTDLAPNGEQTRLANDIFPDDLFTPGTRVRLFYKARFIGQSVWNTLPDTASTGTEGYLFPSVTSQPTGGYLEWEALPSSMSNDSDWNCVLYVDHADGYGKQRWIEAGLATVLPQGSDNPENTAWDRYDATTPSGDLPVGRPMGSEYGANLNQLGGYRAIVWDAGSLNRGIDAGDVDVLVPWLNLGCGIVNNLYLSGDALVQNAFDLTTSDPEAYGFLNDYMGVQFECGTFREVDCPVGGAEDTTACIAIDPVVGAVASTRTLAASHAGLGNGCPQLRSFDVLSAVPSPAGGGTTQEEEEYDDTVKGVTSIASISVTHADYKGLVDGLSLAHRRDAGDCIDHPAGEPSVDAIADRLTEFLAWAGYDGPNPTCFDLPTTDAPEPGPPPIRTALLAMAPNPLVPGARGVIGFSLAAESRVQLDVFDVRGARVAVLVDANMPAGEHEAVWRGTDDRGRPVASGVYFYRLSVAGEAFSRKMVVIRGGAQ